ncbi:MAG: hypothetical protein HQ534_08205 [Armatimonadetes bacterium]|nr:hypothetical protein [Armatimonadota bacterium]
MKKLFCVIILMLILTVISRVHAVDITIRTSQGGLYDKRASENALGGGQLALDVKLNKLPIVLSLAGEYYKKGPEAIEPYEIQGMTVIYVLYSAPLLKNWKSNYYFGPGIAFIEVPKENSNSMEKGIAFDTAAGINIKAFWKIGVYVEGKYIYSSKTVNNEKVIDFSDVGLLIGFLLNFCW